MSKATIVSAIGEGLYQAELNFNTEVIQFNLERYRMRLDDIDNVDGPAADQALADAEADLITAADHLQELIKQLSGQPSDELTATLAAIESDLTNASDALDQVNTGLLGAAAWVDSSQNALPTGVPVEITDAYAIANAALTLAFSALNDEQNGLTPAQSHLDEVHAAVALSPPDLITAQNSLGLLRQDLVQVSTDHVQASGAINNAHSEIQAARNLLPADATYDTARADLDSALAEFTDISTDHAAAAAYESDAATKADKAQDLLTPGNEAIRKEVKDAIATLNTARTARTAAKLAVDTLDLEYAGLHRRIADLGAIPVAESRELWCADLTEDLPGGTEVGTMEVPGEFAPYKETVIRPAFAPEHTHLYDRARDGWLTPTAALTPEAYFYNRAMLPGWQVFRPTFRFAVCTAINADGTMDVGLVFPNTSSQQGINVTPQSIPEGSFAEAPAVSFTHVPVKYMDCDIEAFSLGDIVVVQFENQKAEKPRVIGFRDHPRSCCPYGILAPLHGLKASAGEGGTTWTAIGKPDLRYGEVCWYGKVDVLTWRGTGDRYHGIVPRDIGYVESLADKIYRNDKELVQAPGRVVGAAINYVFKKLLAVVIHEDDIDKDEEGFYSGAFNTNMPHQFYWRVWPLNPAEIWTLVATLSIPNPISDDPVMVMHPWCFNDEGTEGGTMFYSPAESPSGGPMYFEHEIKATIGETGVTLENLGNAPNGLSTNTGPYVALVDYDGMERMTMTLTRTSVSGIPHEIFHDHAYLDFNGHHILYEELSEVSQRVQQFTYIDPARGYLTYANWTVPAVEAGEGFISLTWEVWHDGEVIYSTALWDPYSAFGQNILLNSAGAVDRKGNLVAIGVMSSQTLPQVASFMTDQVGENYLETLTQRPADQNIPLGVRC
jgi:hypothetical protein